jgi:hypothetical protein
MLRARQIVELVVIGVLAGGVALSTGMGLSACSAPEQPAKDAQQPDDQPQPTVFSDTVDTMDRARAVQETADQHARDLEQAERQAEGR